MRSRRLFGPKFPGQESAGCGGEGSEAARKGVLQAAGQSITRYISKYDVANIWIRDVFCYPYAQDKCPIMNQRPLSASS